MCIEYYVFSLDEETIEEYHEKSLERQPFKKKKSKPVDEDKPKSDISDSAIISMIVIKQIA